VIRAMRILLRLVTAVLVLSAAVIILVGGFWYAWQVAVEDAPRVSLSVDADNIEKSALGLYLRLREADVSSPPDPNDTEEVTFAIASGESVTSVAYNLQSERLVVDAELFRRFVQYHGLEYDIQAGVYTLKRSMTMDDIMQQLRHGRLPTRSVTIPEGWRSEQIAELLQEHGLADGQEFLQVVQMGQTGFDFLGDRPAGSPTSCEGFLYPDTYQFPENISADRIVEIMLRNWEAHIPDRWFDRAAENSMTFYEVVTLASIVEREAVLEIERPMIAGVYLNRLAKGMYLQSDPTVQYAKGYDPGTDRWWSPMLQEEAITVVSPYNTFLNPGMPPSPICNPRANSIQAVLEPDGADYLFFYHKGDGSHAFAETYEEHLENQQIFGQ